MKNFGEESVEMQTLQAEYNKLKSNLIHQKQTIELLQGKARKRNLNKIEKEIRNRILINSLGIPSVIIICYTTSFHWAFALFICLWSLIDLCFTWWIKKELDAPSLLNADVKTATIKINKYHQFYMKSFIVGMVCAPIILAYIFIHIYGHTQHIGVFYDMLIIAGITILLSLVSTVVQYKKHQTAYRELIDSFL